MPEVNVSRNLFGTAAIVTGGTSGIGRAIALGLSRCGASVVVGDLQTAQQDEELSAARVRQVICDVRREADVVHLVEAAASQAPLRVVVNNAGIGLVKQIPDVSEQEWDNVVDTNLKAAFLTAKHAVPHLRRAGGGSMINIASNAGLLPRHHDPVYSISKAALVALTKSLALCHADDRIRVNAICPGPVSETGMMNADLAAAEDPEAMAQAFIDASPLARAMGRMVRPEEVAEAALYLASDAAAAVTGTIIAIDGGKSLGVPPPR